MLQRVLLFLILSQLPFSASHAEFLQIGIRGQSLCLECSILVHQSLREVPIHQSSKPNSTIRNESKDDIQKNIGEKNVLFVFRNKFPFLQDLERLAIRNILQSLSIRSSFAKKLVSHALLNQTVNFHIYYQLGIDLQGQTSFYNAEGLPSYEIDKINPHELWGFYFQSNSTQTNIFINEYQHPWNAWFTVTHELFHLFDSKVKKYIENKAMRNEAWTRLDDLALEYRATYAEVLVRREMKESSWFSSEPLLREDYRDQFLRGRTINHKLLAEKIIDLFYLPEEAGEGWTLDTSRIESEFLALFDFSLSPKSLVEIPLKLPKSDTFNSLHFLSFFAEQKLAQCEKKDCGDLSLVTAPYAKKSKLKNSGRSEKLLSEIQNLLRAQNVSSFYEYLSKVGLIDPAGLEPEFSDKVIEVPNRSSGPSPRINGGG